MRSEKLRAGDRVLIVDKDHPFEGEVGYVVGFGMKEPVRNAPRVRLPEIMDHEVYVRNPQGLKRIGG